MDYNEFVAFDEQNCPNITALFEVVERYVSS